jgi:hypothetical protein
MIRSFWAVARGLAYLAGALLLLLAGLILTEGFWHVRHHRYTPLPMGIFYGHLSGQGGFILVDDSEDLLFPFKFTGETTPTWYWNTSSTKFHELTLSWAEQAPTALGGSVRLFLPSMRFENAQTNGLLTREALTMWLVNHNRHVATNAEVAAVVGEVYRVLQSAGDGSLPEPNHHGYRIEHQGRRIGSYLHGRPGFGLSIPGWLWVLAWPAACGWAIRWGWRRFGRLPTAVPPAP